jgi:hypothetical protein
MLRPSRRRDPQQSPASFRIAVKDPRIQQYSSTRGSSSTTPVLLKVITFLLVGPKPRKSRNILQAF